MSSIKVQCRPVQYVYSQGTTSDLYSLRLRLIPSSREGEGEIEKGVRRHDPGVKEGVGGRDPGGRQPRVQATELPRLLFYGRRLEPPQGRLRSMEAVLHLDNQRAILRVRADPRLHRSLPRPSAPPWWMRPVCSGVYSLAFYSFLVRSQMSPGWRIHQLNLGDVST